MGHLMVLMGKKVDTMLKYDYKSIKGGINGMIP
jgi:hypothetical protein